MCGHYLFARVYNNLFHVTDGDEIGFMWWFSLEHFDLVSISWGVGVMFHLHEYGYYLFSEYRILFSSGFEWLVMGSSQKILVCVGIHMNFMYLLRFSTSLVMKLVCDIEDVVAIETSYGFISMTSSSSIFPFPFSFSLSIYSSYISWIFSSMYLLSIVVATTRHSRTNDLTMSKALSRAIK